MNCQDTVLLLSEFDRQQLEPGESESVSEHLQGCVACQQELDKSRELRQILQHSRKEMPAGFMDDLWREVEAQIQPAGLAPFWRKPGAFFQRNRQLALAAAVMLVAIIAVPVSLQQILNPPARQQAKFEEKAAAPPASGIDERPEDGTASRGMLDGESMRQRSGERQLEGQGGDRLAQTELLREQDKHQTASQPAEEPMLLGAARDGRTDMARNPGNKLRSSDQYNDPKTLVKQGSLQLEVGDAAAALRQVETLVEKFQGFLVNTQLYSQERSPAYADLLVKLPRKNLRPALHALEQLGTVRVKQMQSEDISRQSQATQLEIERLRALSAREPAQLDLKQALKAKQQELARLQQMLQLFTLELKLQEKYSAPWLDWDALMEKARARLGQSLDATLRALIDVVGLVPPLLLYGGILFAIWLTLKWLLVTRLVLMAERTLAAILLSAAIYFPLYLGWQREFAGFLLFGALLAAGWAGRVLFRRLRQPRPDK